jgi:hypothetical protein
MADKLSIKDYLETATDAAKRVRFTMIVLVVVTVLVLAGFLNSWYAHSWAFNRIEAMEMQESPYNQLFLEQCKKDVNSCLQDKELRHTNLAKSLIENNYNVKVPFFGVSFDINDLGLLGGLSLMIVLSMLRLSLKNYIVALRIGFKAAFKFDQEEDFYDILGTRQLFVFPDLEDKNQRDTFDGVTESLWTKSSIRNTFLKITLISEEIKNYIKEKIIYQNLNTVINPVQGTALNDKLQLLALFTGFVLIIFFSLFFGALTTLTIFFALVVLVIGTATIYKLKKYRGQQISLPAPNDYWSSNPQPYLKRIPRLICLITTLVYFLVVTNDFQSLKYGLAVDPKRAFSGFTISIVFLIGIAGLSLWCVSKWVEIDRIWGEYKQRIESRKT